MLPQGFVNQKLHTIKGTMKKRSTVKELDIFIYSFHQNFIIFYDMACFE